VFLGSLENGLGLYRFVYNGGTQPYVGVIAQEVQTIAPQAIVRGSDGFLRVRYERLGLQFQTYDAWVRSGARLPAIAPLQH
jgi:Chaperone of endosialidase